MAVFDGSGWVGGVLALAGAYLLFAGQVSAGEALAAVPAVGAGVGLAVLFRRHARHDVSVNLASFAPVKKAPGALVRDTVKVGVVLLRPVARPESGVFLPAPLAAGGPAEAGVAVLAESVAPNGYVIEAGEHGLVMHRLAA